MIKSARASWWNYGAAGWYFVTICTQHRVPFFGRITDGRMIVNDIGAIAAAEWEKSFDLRPDMNLAMGEYIVMPDHFHAIIGIGRNRYNSELDPTGIAGHTLGPYPHNGSDHVNEPTGRDAMHCIPANVFEKPAWHTNNRFGPQSKNLASVIRGFKISVTRNAKPIRPDFAWQARYHDHIIRDEGEFRRIERYIIQNPSRY
jgi:REP element-mobilizing transposase RayT